MTAHRQKPTITPERIAWFAQYHADEPAWGEFHVPLDDGNWDCEAAPYHPDADVRARIRAEWPDDLRDAAEWFDLLTPSQRRRLSKRVGAHMERWAALFSDDDKQMSEWTRTQRWSDTKIEAHTSGVARWLVIRNGLGHILRRIEITPHPDRP